MDISANGPLLVCGGNAGARVIPSGLASSAGSDIVLSTEGTVRSVALSRDGRRVAFTSGPRVIVRELAPDAPVSILNAHRDGVFSVAFSPDGLSVASVAETEDTRVLVCDVATRQVRQGADRPHRQIVVRLVCSGRSKNRHGQSRWDGQALGSRAPARSFYHQSTEGRARPTVFGLSQAGSRLFALRADGKVLAVNISTGEVQDPWRTLAGPTSGGGFSPDGRWLAKLSADGKRPRCL